MSPSNPQQLLNDAFEAIDVMVAVLDREMNFLRVNRAWAAHFGADPSYFLGKKYVAINPDPETQAVFQTVIRTGQAAHHKLQGQIAHNGAHDGSRFHSVSVNPVRDDRGYVVNLVVSAVETGECSCADAVLDSHCAESGSTIQGEARCHEVRIASSLSRGEFTRAVLDTVGSIVIVLDRQGRICLFNHACERLTGYSAKEALGRPLWDFLLTQEERDSVKAALDERRDGAIPYTHENYWVTKDGSRRWIAFTNTTLRNSRGDVEYVISTGLDMTERRMVDEALRQSEQQFRLLSENIDGVFWLVSPDRKAVYYISPAFEKIWGRPRADVYADPMTFLEGTPEDDRVRILAHLAEQASGEFNGPYDLEYRIRRADGKLRWISSRYVPVRDEYGRIFRVAGVSVDITERKQLEQERLEHERNQRNALVREVHHRIKNNLQGVVGLLRLHGSRQPQLTDVLEGAVAQVTTMALVHGLQSKGDGGAIMLCDMCDAIAAHLKATFGDAAQLTITRHSGVPFAIAENEAVSLALVINELMYNTLKHSTWTDSLEVGIDIGADGEGVLVRLRNPGSQLPDGLNVMRGTGVGTGLGLVRTLLPKDSSVTLKAEDGWIETELRVSSETVRLLRS